MCFQTDPGNSKEQTGNNRPYVVVNVAMSADGKISTRQRRQVKLSGELDFKRVDMLKAGSDAVVVGIGTVLADDPSLTVKSPDLSRERVDRGKDPNPVRIVIDSMARTPPAAAILHKGQGLRIIACSRKAPADRLAVLRAHATIIQTGEEEVDLKSLFAKLTEYGIRSLMVEGGGTLIWSLFQHGLIDEFSTFISNRIIGGKDAPTPADGDGFISEDFFPGLCLVSAEQIEDGVLIRWRVLPVNPFQ